MTVELIIENKGKLYYPVVESGITWSTERKGAPSELKFTVIKDSLLDFTEGNAVSFKVDGNDVFYGFVFSKKRSKEKTIEVTCYDQLRYFKNKQVYVYSDKTANEFIELLANDFSLAIGELENTGFKIPSRVEDNKTLFDMAQEALDITLQYKNEMYVLFDDFGKISLKNISNMIVPILIDEETGENFSYSSSIDVGTYNQVLLYNKDGTTPSERFKLAKDDYAISNWGILQFFDAFDSNENGQDKADMILKLYNKKTRTLSVSGAFGDIRVRAGTMVPVKLNLGDIITNNLMLVEKAKHSFENGIHNMDLTLRGGEFIA